ncbi:Protein disulfide-isomerase [Pleurostoma richardsiae]|uniref:Protein disulfide-isomerase n=1 Tax=Pleurostoma richardsiae TaxID=41990 RepID=A0AA38RF79_9PEZI|nr:Protein disulfide-isomerase [Pleurostoma richardsiae]
MWQLNALNCLLVVTGVVLAQEPVSVSPDSLERALAANEFSLVAFVAPSEPKTKSFREEWISASRDGSDALIWVDCEALPTLCQKHGVDTYPTFKFFQGRNAKSSYLGPRRASGFLNFIARSKRPTMAQIDVGQLKEFKVIDETAFIGYFAPEDTVAKQTFSDVAARYRDEFSFGIVSDTAVFGDQNVKPPTVVCHKPEDGDTHSFSSFSEAGDALEKFVIEASRPVIGELTKLNQQRLLDRGWPMIYVFAETEPERAKLRQTLHRFAKGQYEALTAVTVDPFEFPELQAQLGLEPGVFPSGAVHQLSKDRIYPYPKDLPVNSNALSKFGLDVYQGRVEPWTPPGVTTAYTDLDPIHTATRKVSIRSVPGLNIRIAGHDEL